MTQAMNNYTAFAQAITDQLAMQAVAEHYGLIFNKAGFAVCPFHPEKTASFKIDGQYGHCFGCGWNHGTIRFVMELHSISFQDAVEKINADFGLNLPINRRLTLREQRQAEQRRAELDREREIKEAAIIDIHEMLKGNTGDCAYCKFKDAECSEKFCIEKAEWRAEGE